MELADLSKPGEKKKLIWAAALGFLAILFLWWTFVGFGSAPTPSGHLIRLNQFRMRLVA